jgi:hypothetical protein
VNLLAALLLLALLPLPVNLLAALLLLALLPLPVTLLAALLPLLPNYSAGALHHLLQVGWLVR